MHFSTPIISAILALSTQATALGINCRGSSNCISTQLGKVSLQEIINTANQVGDHHIFQNGEHVACVQGRGLAGGSLCAFPQGTNGGIEGWKAKQLLGFLKDHNCGNCGSVPVNFPNDNNVGSAGQLTVNWVR
ncbi:killer toxin [Massarina eburnea CBS 473.64]|uniref:Killer toxin n=1 Tax=Massarina eburnea CBS 473.64 TaxID=1395130 RepID=A0A6A6RLF7_9PLEO|nr:killer toxin [Massarina eburnea CBS 473.64]